jgi:hypothetical protein
MGQMKQILSGEDVTATAPEEGQRKVQRGGPAPFNLYPRREGTGTPVTADELQERIYALQKRDDLTDEARSFLQRAEWVTPTSDKDGVLSMLDEQISKIERGEEGVANEGRGKFATYQGFPIQTPETSTTAPTVAAGKDFAARSSADAKALADARRAKYEAGIAANLTPAEAARRASLIKQADVTGPFVNRETEAAAPAGEVSVQKRGKATEATTLRGPSAEGKSLSYPDALEQQLRVLEDLQQDNQGQLPLFKEKELASTETSRATPATFRRYLASQTVQEMRDASAAEKEAEAKALAEDLAAAQKTKRSISELEAEFASIKNLFEQGAKARSILQNSADIEAAINKYGKLKNDPQFSSLLRLTAATKSEEHARLQEDIATYTKLKKSLEAQIATTKQAIAAAGAGKTFEKTLKENRVKLEILMQQTAKLAATGEQLKALEANAVAAAAAVNHIDRMLAVIRAKTTLAELKDKPHSGKDVADAQVALLKAIVDRKIAAQESKAKDTLRDTTDRTYQTRRKVEEMSAARTRAWHQLSSLPSTTYRARTAAEERAFVTASPGEVTAALKYERHLAGMAVLPLKMELGRLEQQARVLEQKIKTAKDKSVSYLKKVPSKEELDAQEAIDEKKPKAITTEPEAQLKTAMLQGIASMLKDSHLEGNAARTLALKKEFDALNAELKAFAEYKKKSSAEKGESLTMYGPKGSVLTKPAFIGVEGYLKQQADLAVKIDALEKELAAKEAAATPIATRKGEEETRAVAPATYEEEEYIGTTAEKAAERAAAAERVKQLEAALKSAQEDGDKKLAAGIAKDLGQARTELKETTRAAVRRQQLLTRQTSEPSKLRTGTEESKAAPGYVRKKFEEGKVEKQPTVEAAVETGNKLSEEKALAAKKVTKKAIKEMSLAQQDALQKATFDRLMYVRQQVSDAQSVVNNLKQAQADYAAGRRKTFNGDVLKKANERLADLTAELERARLQAGIAEDIGTMTKTELSSAAREAADERKKGKSAKDIEAQTTEAAISDVYLGQDLDEGGTEAPSKFVADRTTTPLSKQAAEMAKDGRILDLADDLAENGSTPAIRATAAKLRPLLLRTKLAVDKDVNYKGESVAGLYSPEKNTITMHPEGLTEEDVLHEMAHAATDYVLLADPAALTADQRDARKGLEAMRASVAKSALFKGEQGVDNVREFAAEVESNKDFRNKLDSVGKPTSILQRALNFLKRMLGIEPKSAKAQALVDRILAPSRKLAAKEAPSFFREKVQYKSDDALSELADTVVARPKTMSEKTGSNIALRLEMDIADMRAGATKALNNAVEDPKTMGSTRLFRQAIFSITAADQHGSVTQMALSEGPPVMYKDSKGFYEVRSSGKNDAVAVFDAIQDIPDSYGNAQAKIGLASTYMIAQRAMNKGLKKLDLGALGVTEEKLTAAMAAVNADPKLKDALENVRAKYNAYNRGMLEWLSSPQVGAISQADAKAYLKDEDYVPYYRVRADGVAELVFGGEKTITIGDIRHQPYLAELKGGEDKIMPLDQSIMRNTMLLVTKGMNNMAMKNVAYAMQAAGQGLGPVDKNGKPTNLMPVHVGKGPADASVIRWTQEPDPRNPEDKGDRYLRVQTDGTIFGGVPAELIIKSLEGAHLTLPAFLKWGGIAGDLLRAGVTRNPIYVARQLFRDPFAATATSGLDYGPLTAIFKANREFLKISAGKSETNAKLIEKGLRQSGIFEGDPANMSKMALQLASGKSQGVFDKLFRIADKAALDADAATRALIYENAIKNGLSEVEASHSVRESMNFTKRGLSPTVQYASRMIPFFNAQIQGLSVLFKAATGNMPANDVLKIKRKFFNNAMMLTGFGIAYAMAMDDDEYYKNAKPRDRYTNFFVPLPGVDEPLKLPIPYEFGFFFSAGVAAADAIKGEVDTPQQLRALKDMFVGAIPGASSNFVPQIVKPVAEVYANKSFFSGNSILSSRLAQLDPEAQYKDNTTEFAKWMATMVPGLSPIQLEHIVSGYLGQLPLMAVATTNDLFRDGRAEPTRKMSDMPVIGSSFQRKYGGEEADVVYKLAAEAVQAKRTFDNYRNTGKLEDAKDYLQENRAEISVAPMALQYQKIMGTLRKQEDIIRSSNASSDEKAKRIDELDKQRQLQSERYLQSIRRVQEANA